MKTKKGLKRRLIFALCLSLMPIGGCSQTPDALTLLEASSKEMEKLNSYEVNLTLGLNMGFGDGKSEINIGMNGEGFLQMINDPYASYGEVTVTVDSFGQEDTVVSKSYQYEKDGKILQYVDDGSGWSTQSSEGLTADTAQITMSLFDYSFAEKCEPKVVGSETIDGKDTWKVEFTASFEDLMELSEEEVDESAQVFLSSFGKNLQLTCTIYIDKETKRYAKTVLTLTGLEELMNLISKFSEDVPEGMEISMDDVAIEFTYGRFDEVDQIDIPKEVEDLSVDNAANNAWGTMKVSVGSSNLVIGESSLQQLIDAGFVLDDTQAMDKTMESGDVQYCVLTRKGNEFYVGIENTTSDTIDTKEATIYSFYGYYLQDDIVLEGGIHAGSTASEVKKAYGEPLTVTDEDYYDLWYYEINDSFSSKYLELGLEDGVVTDIDLSVYYFGSFFA